MRTDKNNMMEQKFSLSFAYRVLMPATGALLTNQAGQ
jgi:hypothetical protein